MAKSNPKWGYTRIRGALLNLGHTVARSTIANILREHGIEPAPERSERTPWRTFLAAHWETVAATDFFTVEVATVRRLVTYYVLVVIELSSRKVHIAGITPGVGISPTHSTAFCAASDSSSWTATGSSLRSFAICSSTPELTSFGCRTVRRI